MVKRPTASGGVVGPMKFAVERRGAVPPATARLGKTMRVLVVPSVLVGVSERSHTTASERASS